MTAHTSSSAAPDPRTQLIAMGALILVSCLWGSMVPVTALALEGYDAFLLSAIRYSCGAIILLVVVGITDPIRRLMRLPWLRIALCGMAAGTFVLMITVSLLFSDPITISALMAAAALVAAIFARFDSGARIGWPVVVGIVAAVVGGILVAMGQPGPLRLTGGETLVVLSMAVWTWYSLRTQDWLAPIGLSQLQISALSLGWGAVLVWVAYAIALACGIISVPAEWPAFKATASMVWLTLGPTAAAITLWNFANARVGVIVATLTINLVPVVSVMIAMAFGFMPTPYQVIGGLTVLAGVVWMQIFQMRRAAR
ncbi:MAG: DMT family transporter [Dongiaceae bacterium]